MPTFKFDKDYYDRFYRNPSTRVCTAESVAKLGDFVCSYGKYLGGSVSTVLDVGCGFGYWQPVIARHFPNASYTGVEFSEYLCRTYGWTRGSVVDFAADRPFDLVICQGVLQYLDDEQADLAIKNLGRLTRQFLYLEVLTIQDWTRNCDQSVTDGETFKREGNWYRERLAPLFQNLGGGVFLKQNCGLVLYELERPS